MGMARAQTFTVSGYIADEASGEKLIGANIYDSETFEGGISNTYGFYSITLPAGTHRLTISYIGYASIEKEITLDKDISLDIDLDPSTQLEEIEIVAEKQRNVAEESTMSTIEIPILQIKKVPALLGEVDVLKALQLLPGVQSGGEGQSGLYVRGGSPDQNLILLDGVPVYNVNHLFGFFSVFNADAIKEVKLIKGGYPARYGGRLSSVLEINMKEGNMKELKGEGSIGLVASKLTLEGPIKADKTSFIVSGRRTYIDLLARPLIKKAFEEDGSEGLAGYHFYDLNAKVNHIISDKDRLYFSVYAGNDKFFVNFKETDDTFSDSYNARVAWGNVTSALRWNHLWTPKLFSNATLTYSQYKLDFGTGFGTEVSGVLDEEVSFDYDSGIYDVAAKIDFDYYPNTSHFIRYGISAIHHRFEPGEFNLLFVSEGVTELDTAIGQRSINSMEFDAYVEDDIKVTDKLKANVGVHLSAFAVEGEFYTSAQPRLSLRYLVTEDQSFKFSFATMQQYMNLLTSEGIGLPTDLWVPSTAKIKPQKSWQVAAGYAFKLNEHIDITVEGYYKDMQNLVSFKEGEGFFEESLRDWGDRITQGNGTSYGAELFVQKKTGDFTGWIGYTLSWSNRQFDEINFGQEFPFRYDRRHDISLVGQYELSKRISFSGAWVFGTGNAVTLANSTYKGIAQATRFDIETEVDYYTDRNNFRMNNYHRLDIGVNFTKKKKKHTRVWSIGAYNTYNRRNPYFIFIDTDRSLDNQGNFTNTRVLKQQSLFPVIPYFNYSFNF